MVQLSPVGSYDTLKWRVSDDSGELEAYLTNKPKTRVAWAPQPGSQQAYMDCPVLEALLEGTRGGGKTVTFLMDFAQGVGKGHGADVRGILFRRTFPELKDIVEQSLKWFTQVFPSASFNKQKHEWRFKSGESLRFGYMQKPQDYYGYHGHNYTWIGWEELTTWPDDVCYKRMFSTLRTANPKIRLKIRATTNPYGVGHNWVKARFRLPVGPKRQHTGIIRVDGEPERVAIHSHLRENRVLLHADPMYIQRIRVAARNKSELDAWEHGSWDIIAGGMFDDLWAPTVHILPTFPASAIPHTWRIDRSYDHGQSKPFSVGWWAESNGEPMILDDRKIGTVRGDLIRIAEWYGSTGQPNEGLRMSAHDIARGIIAREDTMGLAGRVEQGVADASIFDVESVTGERSVAGDMSYMGIDWDPSDKRPGSRKQGWEKIRSMLRGAVTPENGHREEPGLYVSEDCHNFLRTIPVLPRSDRDPDDANTEAEDHIADETRYRCRHEPAIVRSHRSAQIY